MPTNIMALPVTRVTRLLSLVSLAADNSAFMIQPSSNRPDVPHASVRSRPRDTTCLPPPFPSRKSLPGSSLLMGVNPEETVGDAHASATREVPSREKAPLHQDKESLEAAFGAGQGKHAGKKRRRHSNKYSSQSKASEIDPWEQQLRLAQESTGEAGMQARLEMEEIEERRIQRRIERGDVIYPDEEDIDPYDPSTFGYIEVGHIQGAHGVKGEVKVRSSTDFAVNRLCTPGVKHVKAPNRRFPRDVELLAGRLQKEDIFLLQFEGITSRDSAAGLRGHKVYVLEDEEVDLEENEYMVRDLVGARAYRADDESVYIGEVVGVVLGDDMSSTVGLASDMLELRLPCETPSDVPKVCYIPFVPAFAPVVRLDGGNSTILMDLPEGLLDLAVEMEEKVAIRGLLPGKANGKQ